MKKSRWILLAFIAVSLALVAGYFLGKRGHTPASSDPTATSASAASGRKILYWKGPMDPNYRSDKPGLSPMGMKLVPVYADDSGAGEASDVKISPATVNNLGVQTTEVEQGTLSHQLELVGYVGYDEDTITSINTRADGWVEKLAVKSAGDAVHRGQLLYQLFSPKLATAEREYLTSLASGSQSLVAASRERMRALGFTTAQIDQLTRTRKTSDRVSRYAESAGVVMSLGVSEGAYVMPATQVMKLADLRTVWVLVEVDESQAGLLHVGQEADAVFDAFPGRHWQGVVDYVYPDLSAMTRTVKVRLRFANSDLRLQPNMYAHITMEAKAQHEGQAASQPGPVYIPNLALIRTGQSQRVIVALGDGRFDICPVQAGLTSGDKVQILKGLRVGQRVVTSAMFLIDSEANVDTAALNYGSAKPGCSEIPGTPVHGATSNSGPTDKDLPGADTPEIPTAMAPANSASGTTMQGMDMPAKPAGTSLEPTNHEPPVKPAHRLSPDSNQGTPPSDHGEHDMKEMSMPASHGKEHQP